MPIPLRVGRYMVRECVARITGRVCQQITEEETMLAVTWENSWDNTIVTRYNGTERQAAKWVESRKGEVLHMEEIPDDAPEIVFSWADRKDIFQIRAVTRTFYCMEEAKAHYQKYLIDAPGISVTIDGEEADLEDFE